ncbi:MAG: hypothetical protein ABH803_01140 [Candidatus Micrarchaeota archaeon]
MKKIIFLLLLTTITSAFLSEFNYLIEGQKYFPLYPCMPSQPEIHPELASTTEFKQVIDLMREAREEARKAQEEIPKKIDPVGIITQQMACNEKLFNAMNKALEAVKKGNELIDEKSNELEKAFSQENPGLASGTISELNSEKNNLLKKTKAKGSITERILELNELLTDFWTPYQAVINKVFEKDSAIKRQKTVYEKLELAMQKLLEENNELRKKTTENIKQAKAKIRKNEANNIFDASNYDLRDESNQISSSSNTFYSQEYSLEAQELLSQAENELKNAEDLLKKREKGFLGESNNALFNALNHAEESTEKSETLEKEAREIEAFLEEKTNKLKEEVNKKLAATSFTSIASKDLFTPKKAVGTIGNRIKIKYQNALELEKVLNEINTDDFIKIKTEAKTEDLLKEIKNKAGFSEEEKILEEVINALKKADSKEQEYLLKQVGFVEEGIQNKLIQEYGWAANLAMELSAFQKYLPEKQADYLKTALETFSGRIEVKSISELETITENLKKTSDYIKENKKALISTALKTIEEEKEIDAGSEKLSYRILTFTNTLPAATQELIETNIATNNYTKISGEATENKGMLLLNGMQEFEEKTIILEKREAKKELEPTETTIIFIPTPQPENWNNFLSDYMDFLEEKKDVEKELETAVNAESSVKKNSLEYQQTTLVLKDLSTLLKPLDKAKTSIESGKNTTYSRELLEKNLEDSRKKLSELENLIDAMKSKAEKEVSLAEEKTKQFTLDDSVLKEAKNALDAGNYLTAYAIAKKVSPPATKNKQEDYILFGAVGLVIISALSYFLLKYKDKIIGSKNGHSFSEELV